MDTFKYSDLLLHLEGFDPWLSSLGLTLHPNDRIHEAFKILRKAEEASRGGRETGIYTDIQPGDWFPIIESLEAHDIFTAFKTEPSPAIAAALKRALSGPHRPIDESPKNRDGRNVWYELALAAEWRLWGATVVVAEPDLQLILQRCARAEAPFRRLEDIQGTCARHAKSHQTLRAPHETHIVPSKWSSGSQAAHFPEHRSRLVS